MSEWILITSDDLPTLPHVATRVVSIVGNPGTSAADLEKVICADPALTQRLLRMANSAMFAGSSKVENLRSAITRLGFQRVKNLVLIAATKDVFNEENPTAMALWNHSLGVAIGCRLIAQELKIRNFDDIFLSGLFHDVGKVLINNQKPEKYQEIVDQAVAERRHASEVEKEVFQFSHEEVGAFLIKKWGLPENLINPVRYHHMIQSEDCEPIPDEKTVAIVATADLIANIHNIGPLTSVVLDPTNARSSRLLGLTQETIFPIVEALPEVFEQESNSFS